MNQQFLFKLRVRYAECDAQQVVFNARYADYADLAVTEYFRLLFGGIKDMLRRGLDTQVVRFSIDWMAPARFDDVLAIGIETTRVGTTSFTLRLSFADAASRKELAVAELTYVLVSAGQHQKMTIGDDFRAALLRGAPGQIIDQSGQAQTGTC